MADDLDARMQTLSSHTGGEFEAGQLGHRNGQAPNGTEMPVVNARDDRDVTAPIQVGTTAPQRACPSLPVTPPTVPFPTTLLTEATSPTSR